MLHLLSQLLTERAIRTFLGLWHRRRRSMEERVGIASEIRVMTSRRHRRVGRALGLLML